MVNVLMMTNVMLEDTYVILMLFASIILEVTNVSAILVFQMILQPCMSTFPVLVQALIGANSKPNA